MNSKKFLYSVWKPKIEAMMDVKKFLKKGYDIFPVENLDRLDELKKKIFEKAKETVEYGGESEDEFFNKFHKYRLLGTELNDKRMEIIKYCTDNLEIGKSVFNILPNSILDCVGPDIVMQKTTNLVILQPGDPDIGVTHRDSPLNSPFEVVVWIPLVDVQKTMGMYVLDLEKSKKALRILKNPDSGYKGYNDYAVKEGENITVPYGHALLFWPGIVHGSHFNKEDNTRWSLNIRYKNLFSPCGSKGLGEFFELFRLSPIAKLAFEYEKESYK